MCSAKLEVENMLVMDVSDDKKRCSASWSNMHITKTKIITPSAKDPNLL